VEFNPGNLFAKTLDIPIQLNPDNPVHVFVWDIGFLLSSLPPKWGPLKHFTTTAKVFDHTGSSPSHISSKQKTKN
jgi:hypothetical protein